MSDSIIQLYKASAGAGKTYTLAKEFIKLLIEEPYSYNKILAVTFTNKATEEMQRRIVKNLYSIVQGQKETNGMVEDIIQEWNTEGKSISREKIRDNANLALFLILHDYNHFQISTIDSFFQIILRNLAKELGLGAYLNIIIDETEPLDEAIKLLINDLKTDKSLKSWLNDFSEEKSDNNKSWKVDQEIAIFGKNIFDDTFKENQESLSAVLKDPQKLIQFKKNIEQKLSIEKNTLNKFVTDIDSAIASSPYSVDDLPYKTAGAYAFVNQFKKAYSEGSYGDCKELSCCSRAQDAISNPVYWAKGKSPKSSGKPVVLNSKEQALADYAALNFTPLFQALESQREKSMPHILSCQLILEHIYKIGVINSIANKVREINETRNQFLLSDTPTLLNKMISDGDAPFIYEKIGTMLEHIMIDEFQDTSNTQWNNFKPLVKECLSQNQNNLIVGDAKQSIYRFRNGDWRIIEGLKDEKDFTSGRVKPTNLGKNWRSEWEVVNFNNNIFSPQCEEDGTLKDPDEISPIFSILQTEYPDDELFYKFCNVYQSAFQQCTKIKPKQGYVSLEFLPKVKEEEMTDTVLEKLRLKVEELQAKDIPAKDITILTRKGKEIVQVAEYFSLYQKNHPGSSCKYTIISNEAFKLESSKALEMIMDALRVIVNPNDVIALSRLYLNYQKEVKKEAISEVLTRADLAEEEKKLKEEILKNQNLPLYDLAEKLSSLLEIQEIANQESFLFFFFDGINDYITRKSPDIARFIDYWERVLKNKSIPISDNVDGMKIMTIHKSKGLEFKTVIIPFCTWNLYGERSPQKSTTLWCKTTDPSFDAVYQTMPIVPISFGTKMKNSLFAKEYQEERIQRLADAVNLMYVAFTRAERNLILFAELPENDKVETCSALLYRLFEGQLTDNKYESGSLNYEEGKGKEKEENPFDPDVTEVSVKYQSHEKSAQFKSSNKARDLIEYRTTEKQGQQPNEAIERGNLIHYLFSLIQTEKDVESAANQLLFEGIISNEAEKKELVEYAREKIKEHPEWFREGVKLYNECTILFKDGDGKKTTKRPDRVIQDGDKMLVIDYKTGEKHKEHQEQIDEYVNLLKDMGYNAEGRIWYI